MTKVDVRFLDQVFSYDKEEDQWLLTLRRSDIATQDMDRLLLLDLHHPMFLGQDFSYNEDQVQFSYHLENDGLSKAMIEAKPLSEKFRLALNVLDLEEALRLPVTFFLHPDNLFITKDGRYRIAYRAVPEIMTPKSMDAGEFLLQAKCYILTLFTNHQFTDLHNGALAVVDVPPFLNDIRQAATIDDLRAVLLAFYRDKLKEEAASMTSVKVRRYKLYKYATVWLSVAVVIFVLPLIYLVFMQNPFKEKLLQADTAFIKLDYSGVIDELKTVDKNKLPYTQKYELAYAYIKGLDFSKDQEGVILNNVTLKSEELYLDYWIEIGRSHMDDALDIAKRLDDSDLILYALAQGMAQVREDDSLSGSKREEKLKDLQSEYDQYWEKRSSDLTDKSGKVSSSNNSKKTNSSSSTSSSKTSSSNK